MKGLITGLLLVLSIGASAAQIEVHSIIHNKWAEDVDIEYTKLVVNALRGRAAVQFTFSDYSDEAQYKDIIKTLDGLYFDQATGDVMYNNITCATTKVKRGFFGTKRKISPTGSCTFRVVADKASIDNGFRVKQKNRLTLYMDVL